MPAGRFSPEETAWARRAIEAKQAAQRKYTRTPIVAKFNTLTELIRRLQEIADNNPQGYRSYVVDENGEYLNTARVIHSTLSDGSIVADVQLSQEVR